MSNPSEPKESFQPGRGFGIGFQVAIGVVSLLAIVVMTNYIASIHYGRWEMTGDSRFRLSPMTARLLQTITNDLEVTVLFDPSEPLSLYGSVTGLLREYQNVNPRIKMEIIDPARKPAAAELVLARNQLVSSGARNMVLFSYQGRTRPVYERDLSDYDIQEAVDAAFGSGTGTNAMKRKSFKGELMFSSAIFSVLEDRKDKAYFVSGHREHSFENKERNFGYSEFAELLASKSVSLESLVLHGTNSIPADCRLLIVAGPFDPYQRGEVEKIDAYLKRGGRALFLFGYRPLLYGRPAASQLDGILSAWGVRVGASLVMDPDNTISKEDIVVSDFGDHPITRPLSAANDSRLYFSLPRPVGRLDNGAKSADAPQVTELARTGPKAYTVSDVSTNRFRINPAVDRVGVVPLAVAVERGSIQGVAEDRGSTRLVVVGDPILFSNTTIGNVANKDFASLVIHWLLDRSQMLGGIEPRPLTEYRVMLSPGQFQVIRWVFLAGLPFAVLFPGLLVWARRRK